jgi:hypothetical protein
VNSPRPERAAAESPSAQEASVEPFSTVLETWLRQDGHTLGNLGAAFGQKSFAVTILLLMFLPALPLPTGGVTHIFEVIAALLAIQMVAGRSSIWLPDRWRQRQLGGLATDKAIPLISRWIRRLEKISHPRGALLLQRRISRRLIGLSLIATSITALIAPPFSGLDTLPAIAAVVICLGVILEDFALVLAGIAVEAAGTLLIVTIGATAAHWIRQLLNA